MKEILNKLEDEIKLLFKSENDGHDIFHLRRVCNLALYIQKEEGGDKIVIAASAYLHEIHRIIQKETRKYCNPKESLHIVKKILENFNFPEEKKRKILHCIEFHEEYSFSEHGKSVEDIETLILQDADNIDAIGAVGICRTLAFMNWHKKPIFLPEFPLKRETFDESEIDTSTIHHFYSKLLKLKDNMNTVTAKKIAFKRHEFMESFLKEFFKEWYSKS